LNRKQVARSTILQALREVDFARTERLIRINPVIDEPAFWQDDLKDTIEGHPDGYVIPKVETASQIQAVSEFLNREERRYGWMDGSIRLFAIVESARGIVNLKEIASSDPRLTALIFGAEDL